MTLFASICLLSGCDIDSGANRVCSYNVRIENSYVFPEDGGRLQTVRDYLFDSKGILRNVSDRSKDALQYKEIKLTEGDYTLVSWANMGKASRTNLEVVGETCLADMLLMIDDPSKYPGYSQNSEKLYFGTQQFSVKQAGITYSTLLMRRTYASLRLSAVWIQPEQRPGNNDNFNFRLSHVRSEYPFANPFSLTSLKYADYMAPATMNEAGEIVGELVSYRYSNKTRQLIRLYDGEKPLTEEIDLTPLFEKLNLDLDTVAKQEYIGTFEINGNKTLIILNEKLQDSN